MHEHDGEEIARRLQAVRHAQVHAIAGCEAREGLHAADVRIVLVVEVPDRRRNFDDVALVDAVAERVATRCVEVNAVCRDSALDLFFLEGADGALFAGFASLGVFDGVHVSSAPGLGW